MTPPPKKPQSLARQKKAAAQKIKIDYEKVENLAGRGLTKRDIALCLGFTERTLMKRQKDDKKFIAAMEKGRAAALAAVTGRLFEHIKNGNVTSIIFFLKCRGGWKETSVIENYTAPLLPDSACSPEEAEAAYIASMRAGQ